MNAIVCSSSSTRSEGSSPARILQKMQSSSGIGGVPYRALRMGLLTETELRERVERLAAIERESASDGERAGGRADRRGARGAAGDRARPRHLLVAGRHPHRARRRSPAAGSSACSRRSRWSTTSPAAGSGSGARFLPKRDTTNVVAEFGEGEDTVVVVAHHDAAHSGLVFHPELPRAVLRRFPKLAENAETTPGTMWGAVAGPLLIALGLQAPRRVPLRRLRRGHGRHRAAQGRARAPTTTSPASPCCCRSRASCRSPACG